jgi:hypothetical protein
MQISHGLLDHFRHQKQTAFDRRRTALVGFPLVGLADYVFAQTQCHAEFVGVSHRGGQTLHGIDRVRHGYDAASVYRAHLFNDLKKTIELTQQAFGGWRFKLQPGQLG